MKKKILFIFILFSIFFIPRVVLANSTVDRIHFIKNDSGSGDAIVIESNGHFGLIDTMGPGPTSSLATNNSSLVNATDNGTKVYNYLKKLGCTYLDFVVITNNHTDHNGGISELQELVTNDTIVFYKEDIIVDDDYEESLGMGNHASYLAELDYLDSMGAIKCDVLTCNPATISNSFISNVVKSNNGSIDYETNLKEKIVFRFGDYNIDLYNLYTLSNHNENLNSIITYIKHVTSNKTTLLMSDLESSLGDSDYEYANTLSHLISNPTGDTSNTGLDTQLAYVVGKADIMKSANQGSNNSTSYIMFELIRPNMMVIQDAHVEDAGGISPKRKAVSTVLMAKTVNSTSSYYTSQSDGAIVFEFGNSDYSIKNFSNETGSESNNTLNSIETHISSSFDTGWYEYNYNYISDKSLMYIENGNMCTGSKQINGFWYLFDDSGKMIEGYDDDNDYYYYYYEKDVADVTHPRGSMALGFVTIDNNLFYFRTSVNDVSEGPMGAAISGFVTINSYMYYFRMETNDISNGPINSAILGLATIDGKTYYFRTYDNEVSIGPKGSALKNECVDVGNKNYCFNKNYHSTDVTNYVTIPTAAMCNVLQYTGSEQVLTKDALAGYEWSNNVGLNPGQYSVTATLEESYAWSDNTIGPKTITCSIARIKVDKPVLITDSFDYVGLSYTPDISGLDGNLMTATGNRTGKNVGNYSIVVSLNDTEMNEWADGTDNSVILNWVINKGYPGVPITYDYNGAYDGNPHSITYDPVDEYGTLLYKLTGGEWTTEVPTRTEVGETVVHTKISGNSNYNDSNESMATIRITKAPTEAPTVVGYHNICDGNPHTVTVTNNTNGTVYYKTDDTDWSITAPTRTDAGVTIVYVKVGGDSNHNDSDVVSAEIILIDGNEYFIDHYVVDSENHYISNIALGTNINQFSDYIIVGNGYTLSVDVHPTTGKVYTGGKTQIKQGNTVIMEYTNIVLGDPSGDGIADPVDLLRIRQFLLGTRTLDGPYFLAADINQDEIIDPIDLLRVRQHLLGTRIIN